MPAPSEATWQGSGSRKIVLLHGLGGDRRQPTGLLEPLLDSDWSWFAPDLRGHGDNDLPLDPVAMTIRGQAVEIAGRLTGEGPVTIAGISLGAAIAVELAARQDIPVDALVLIRPAWGWDPDPPNLALYPKMARLLESHDSAEAREQFALSADFLAVEEVSRPAALALLDQFADSLAGRRADRLRTYPSSAPIRPAIGPRALVLGNRLDPVHPLDLARSVAVDLGADFLEVPPRYDEPGAHVAAVRTAAEAFLSQPDKGKQA